MRSSLITQCLLLFSWSSRLWADEKQAMCVIMPAYWYGYHWEQTPDNRNRSSNRNLALTLAYRFPFGLALGGSWLRNVGFAQDSAVRLGAEGPSLGYVGMQSFSFFYTLLYKPVLEYDYPSLDAKTSYYGGSGSMVDLGFHFGSSWLRVGPRVLLIDVNYRKSNATSGAETDTTKLDGSPWKDRWLEPYLGLWLLF